MSVLVDFSIFPTDKGESVSEYVSKVIEHIKETGYDYQLTAMGTLIETETIEEATSLINQSYKILEPYSARVYSSIKMDIRKGKENRLEQKTASIENKIGDVNE